MSKDVSNVKFNDEYGQVKHITEMKDVFDSSRLDYPDTLFKVDGDYAYIDFATEEINKAGIPYSPDFGGREVSAWHFTGSGFTAGKNGTVVPEWMVPKGESMVPDIGSKVHQVVGGKDSIVAEWVIKDDIGYWKDLR